MHNYRDFYMEAMQRGYAARLKSKDDVDQLQAGLADLVRHSKYDDYRDSLMLLVGLWLAAAYAGIDPDPYFQAAAQVADASDPYGTGSTKDMLANFRTYAVFKEGVEPFLPGTSQ